MGKIVILAGSTRKGGNTELLVQAFVKGAEKDNEVTVISVADHKVYPCTGCNVCIKREDHKCVQKDDMESIYETLSKADMIVIASPIQYLRYLMPLRCSIS